LERIPAISLQSVQDDRLERCLEGTGQWFLDNEEFQSWESSSETKLLWVHGKHGCGKSHLAARVIDHLAKTQAHGGRAALSYIYCNPIDASNAARNTGASNENSAMIDLDQLIGTLLKQLLRYLPVSESLPSLEHAASSKDDARPTREQMKTAIAEALSRLQKAFVVIDGLDECHKLGNSHFARFCDFIGSLLPSSLAKIIVFSRPNYSEIESAFAGATSIQVDGGANSEDIKLFINVKMSGLKVSESVLQEITRKMVSRSDGMFLWVDLVSGSLQGERNVRGIRKAIEELPEGLDTVYEWSMARILRQPSRAARERALNLLLWTTNALRPLSREEMMEALAVESDMIELDEEARLVSDDGFITECADLIVLRDGYYQLLHTSLKDYLEATPELASPPLKTYASMQARAQEILAEMCLTYLNFKTFKKGPVATEKDFDQFLKENPFFRYASLNWGKHLDKAKRSELAELAIEFVSSDDARDISLQHIFKDQDWIVPWRRIRNPFPFRRGSTPMHLLAIFDLQSVAEMKPGFWPLIYPEDGYGNRPFKYAIMNSSNAMCHFMLDLDQMLEVRALARGQPVFLCEDALHCAAYLNWPSFTERLMEIGVEKNIPAGSWDTPLHVAAQNGSSLALEALLKGGADPNKTNEEKQTPLTLAARANYADIVEVLVTNGADVSVGSGPHDKTALHIAAKNGNVKIAKLVLEHGADVNSSNNWMGPAINYAVRSGHVELAKMLIHEYKADLRIPCCDGTNLLQLAALSGRRNLVSLLLDLGVQPVITEERGDNILHRAVCARSLDMLRMLLERFPELDLRATNKKGENPMHTAAEFGFLESVQFLLKLDPYLATMVGASAGLPLHLAAREGKVDCVHALTTPENVDTEGPQGRTPLIEAAINGHLSVVKFLVERGADVNKVDADGSSALLAAASGGHLPIVEYLIEHGADINQTDKSNEGLLINLLLKGHFAAADSLLQRGVEANVVTDIGVTPLLIAARLNCTRVASRLLDLGADFKHRWKKDGQTAFMRAVFYQRASMVELFEQRGIVNYGEVDNEFLSAVHWAVRRDNMPMVEKFLAKDQTLAFGLDALGADCLSSAAGYGSESMIPFLLNLGIGPEGLGKHCQGLTPLMRAAVNGRAACVEMLIKAGADVGKVDGAPWYRNAGHWAACGGHPRTTKILLQAGVDATTRDALGYSVADYANMFPKVWQKTRRHFDPDSKLLLEQGARPKDDVILPILRKTVVDCVRATLSLDSTFIENKEWELSNTARPAEATLTEFLRRQYIACLALALKRLSDLSTAPEHQQWSTLSIHRGPDHGPTSSPASSICASSHVDYILADACLCFSEVIRSNYSLFYGVWWDSCWICNSNITNSSFKCRICYTVFLCLDCHANYIKSGRRAPESFEALERLEREVDPVILALDSLRGNVKLLVQSLAALPVVEEWVIHVHSSYDKWNNTYNEYGPFESGGFKGWDFMEIISRAFALRQESLDTLRLTKSQEGKLLKVRADAVKDFVNGDKWVELGNDLMNNFMFFPRTEVYGDSAGELDGCKGHEFIELPASSELSDDQKANFDEHKRLKNEFFEGLLRRYALEHPEKPSPELDTNQQNEKSADKPLEQTRAQINLLEATPKCLDEHPPRPSSPDDNSKESTQSCTPTSSHSGLDYEGGTGSQSKGKGVKANDEADGSDTGDDSESVSSMDSVLSDVEVPLADTLAAELPDVIANLISIVIKSKDRKHDSLFARRLISRIVKKAGPWPPAQA
jgi:ankyrin repeat protein